MKKTIIGVFALRSDAENFINDIHDNLSISHDDISYVYKNKDGDVKEVDTSDISSTTVGESAGAGAKTGVVVGAIAGLATVAGIIPVVGPLFAAGALVTALGITGGLGVTAAGAATGAAVGGLVGALVGMSADKERAQYYEEMVTVGNILVVVNSDNTMKVEKMMTNQGALDVDTYEAQT